MTIAERAAELLAGFDLRERALPRPPADPLLLKVYGGSEPTLRRDLAGGLIRHEKRPAKLRASGRGSPGRLFVTLQAVAEFRASLEVDATVTVMPASPRRVARDVAAAGRRS